MQYEFSRKELVDITAALLYRNRYQDKVLIAKCNDYLAQECEIYEAEVNEIYDILHDNSLTYKEKVIRLMAIQNRIENILIELNEEQALKLNKNE